MPSCGFQVSGFECRRTHPVRALHFRVERTGHVAVYSCASFGFWFSDFGFRVFGFSGFVSRVSCLGFRVSGFGFRVLGFGFRVSGFRFRVSGFGFRVSVSGSEHRFLVQGAQASERPAASERGENHFKGVNDFCLKAKARI